MKKRTLTVTQCTFFQMIRLVLEISYAEQPPVYVFPKTGLVIGNYVR